MAGHVNSQLAQDSENRAHCSYFKIAGITVEFRVDLPISTASFSANLQPFETGKADKDMVHIHHHFGLPPVSEYTADKLIYERDDLSIYKNPERITFICTLLNQNSQPLKQIAFVNPTYTDIQVFNEREDIFREGDIPILSFYQTDQLFISRVLAQRQGCMIHAAGAIVQGKGFLFVGHSTAGKSTMIKLLGNNATLLCDDRMIASKEQGGFRIHGTWHHGEIPEVSPLSASLDALFFLEKAPKNQLVQILDKKESFNQLSSCTIRAIKPLSTIDWWTKTLSVIENLVAHVPCWSVQFDKSGEIVPVIKGFSN